MTFVSFEFIVLFLIFLSLYFILPHRLQNRLLLVTNYVFYGWWDYRFLSLLIISSIIDFLCGLLIDQSSIESDRRKFLAIGIGFNLATLCVFKYFDFFAQNLHDSLLTLGIHVSMPVLNVVLPIGISFYTFQTMSYTIDVYLREVKATRNFLDFLVFVGFFPHLVAGPILRARNLVPQVLNPRHVTLEQFSSGAALALCGFFKKIVIADAMGAYVETVFADKAPNGVAVLFATYAFAFQIYGDFSGYSDIARGIARMIGFDIMVNFRLPYLSATPAEFWRRWHISLSSWIRDYFYIPLGGSRVGRWRTAFNLLFVMTVAGLWHGAANHFVVWGAYHGTLLLVYRLLELANEKYLRFSWPYSPRFRPIAIIIFFHLVCFGWLIFRVTGIDQMWVLLDRLLFDFSPSTFVWSELGYLPLYVALFMGFEFLQERMKDLEPWLKLPALGRAAVYSSAIYGIALLAPEKTLGFIYFAF
jgi:D-alanyl-lipoteichoic acid acyltransferase DltB (MBOAT superfamily)